ncbi:Ornithine cyclodeaminase [Mesorhizobium plurifarium]|uniref:Ornithine cyclodeaminase n=1 Tax=Mesorhizobium plurifarium TaxID=69974 RepID=A0A090DRG1_MESPL|nr:Ornithine cyclodeaminase [Mesorhizobium plurifarium]
MAASRSTLYLTRSDVEAIDLPMATIIDLVEEALVEKAHGRVQMPAKHWMERDQDRWFGGMSSLVPKIGYSAMKWQSGSSENAARGLPYITGMLFLNTTAEGLVVAVMDSTWITQQRTAAASAVAVKHLANPGSRSYAMLGTGIQGRSHLEAFRHVMPALDEVFIYDINPAAARRFADHVSAAGFRPRVVSFPREAVDAADIIVTSGPIEPNTLRSIDFDWLRPGLTGIAIDYDCYWKPEALHAADRLITDDFAQIDHIKAYKYFLGCPDPQAELGDIVAGLKPGRKDTSDKIVVMNMGVAVEDVVTAKAIYEIARERAIGTTLPL